MKRADNSTKHISLHNEMCLVIVNSVGTKYSLLLSNVLQFGFVNYSCKIHIVNIMSGNKLSFRAS